MNIQWNAKRCVDLLADWLQASIVPIEGIPAESSILAHEAIEDEVQPLPDPHALLTIYGGNTQSPMPAINVQVLVTATVAAEGWRLAEQVFDQLRGVSQASNVSQQGAFELLLPVVEPPAQPTHRIAGITGLRAPAHIGKDERGRTMISINGVVRYHAIATSN